MTKSVLDAIDEAWEKNPIDLIRPYYCPKHEFSGAKFELIGADGNQPYEFSAADLYSVSTLGVTVPIKAGIAILGQQAEEFNTPLREIRMNVSLRDLSAPEFEEHLGRGSAALKLWDKLRHNGKNESKWGIGPTTASKIMARKRPSLIPIEDSVVDRVLDRGNRNSWEMWWTAVREGGDALEERANEIRAAINRTDLSTLRVFDVLLWRWGKERGY